MANASKLIFGAAIAAASIATPALAAHKGKPISAHQDGYVTRSTQGSGVYDLYDPGTESPQCQSRIDMADEITNDFNLISIVIRNLDARECIFDQYHQFEAIIHVEFVTEMRFIRNSFDINT